MQKVWKRNVLQSVDRGGQCKEMALPEGLPETLKSRVHQLHPIKSPGTCIDTEISGSFVLYLPTVVLRYQHNPAFALSCRIANQHNLPLLVLVTLLDDTHHPDYCANSTQRRKEDICYQSTVMTARRLAFLLECLQEVTHAWQSHGAAVAIRIHGPECRTPHHLTLARSAAAIVTDEPFVDPYVTYVERVESVGRTLAKPVFRVDGSTSVAPAGQLQRIVGSSRSDDKPIILYKGVPSKAWIWEKSTAPKRRGEVMGVVKEGHFDAPTLSMPSPADFLSNPSFASLYSALPAEWKDSKIPAPGRRPWSVADLTSIADCKAWASQWSGADSSVAPCVQTHGGARAGMKRWTVFRNHHLVKYARTRNNITQPHAVSRLSCYLNLGVISIFQVLFDLYNRDRNATQKFLDEIVKWREIGYVHCFAFPHSYAKPGVLPSWSRIHLERSCATSYRSDSSGSVDTRRRLLEGRFGDEVWDAMQTYLIETGELHNNARMTWGKAMVHWLKVSVAAEDLLIFLCHINDRYALDGLAPPSYAGLLWCLGWCDKPGPSGSITTKPTSRYRTGPDGFQVAQETLLSAAPTTRDRGAVKSSPAAKRSMAMQDAISPEKGQKTILSFFESGRKKAKLRESHKHET
jgi:deoxyribodipyrimidine photolyase